LSAESAGSIGFALAAAAVWGAADFTGGVVTRRVSPSYVVAIAHGSSLILILLYLFASQAGRPSSHAVLFGLAGGLAGGIGLMSLYEALSLGSMGLLASLTGVLTTLIPVAISFLREGKPRPITLVGFAVAIAAIWLIAHAPEGKPHPRGLGLATLAGLSFGFMLTMLKISARDGVFWAIGLSRIASTTIALIFSIVALTRTRRSGNAPSRGFPWLRILPLAVLAGVLDTSGNIFYTFSAVKGRLDVAAVLSSLYPAGTILLAAWLLRERTTRTQTLGMGLALAAVALISI
jgi:drug/metabolite transporter (DMT)-like permease